MNKRNTFLALGLLLSSIASADIYKCSQQGKTTYSDTPCSLDAKPKALPQVSGYAALKFTPQPKKSVTVAARANSRVDEAQARRQRCQAAHELRVAQIKSNYWRPSQDPQRARATDAAFADLMRCQR